MNYVPKIHIWNEVILEIDSIMLPPVDLRILIWISGVFSYYEQQYITDKEIEEFETMDMVLVNPDSNVWDLCFNSYAKQEENFLNFRG